MKEYFSGLSSYISERWNEFWFTPSDVKTVCVMRWLVGALALYYVVSQTSDLSTWFAANGLLTSQTVMRLRPGYAGFSLFNYLRTPTELWIVHGLGIAVLACFLVGFWTRVASIAALIVVIGYVARAPMLTGQFEPVLTFLMAYLCLAPAGACCSVDARIAHRSGKELPTSSWWATLAMRLIQVHLATIYLVAGLTKLGGSYGSEFYDAVWWRGESVWWLIARSDSRLVDLSSFHDFPALLNIFTHAIVALELSFAIMIWNRWARPLLLVLTTIMWVLLSLVTGLVSFAVIMIVAQIAFLPGEFFNRVASAKTDSALRPNSPPPQ